jgi:hypothetical protein
MLYKGHWLGGVELHTLVLTCFRIMKLALEEDWMMVSMSSNSVRSVRRAEYAFAVNTPIVDFVQIGNRTSSELRILDLKGAIVWRWTLTLGLVKIQCLLMLGENVYMTLHWVVNGHLLCLTLGYGMKIGELELASPLFRVSLPYLSAKSTAGRIGIE